MAMTAAFSTNMRGAPANYTAGRMCSESLKTDVWEPLLTGEYRERVCALLSEIAVDLRRNPIVSLYGKNLANGQAGVALFFDYLSKSVPEIDHSEYVESWVNKASLDTSDEGDQALSLYAGAPGIAWAMNVVAPSRPQSAAQSQLDRALITRIQDPAPLNYDLVSGLVGVGLYACGRPDEAARAILHAIVDRLSASAVHMNGRLTWLTPSELLTEAELRLYPKGYLNLGLAHGSPGVIALLARIYVLGIAPLQVMRLLEAAVEWLFAQQGQGAANPAFSDLISCEAPHDRRQSSRLAWCYGDLGVAVAVCSAAITVGRTQWRDAALDVATRLANRQVKDARVDDACICHGAAGNAHIFNRLYQSTRDPVFRDAALRWYDQVMAYRTPGMGIGGYLAWWGTREAGQSPWRQVPGLLRGTAGIGLALVSAIGSVEPSWDHALLVSTPVAAGTTGC